MGIVRGLTHDLDGDAKGQALVRLREVIAAHHTPEGVLLGGAEWLITARRMTRSESGFSVCARLGRPGLGCPHWVVHDIRHRPLPVLVNAAILRPASMDDRALLDTDLDREYALVECIGVRLRDLFHAGPSAPVARGTERHDGRVASAGSLGPDEAAEKPRT